MKTSLEHTDLRIRRTHKLLWEALMAELGERAFTEITVQDICARAMVHRTTFYKHYTDKYDLLERGMRQTFDSLVGDTEHLPPSAYSVDHPPPYFVRLFEHAAQHRQFYRLMLREEGIGRFQKLVKDYIADAMAGRLSTLIPASQGHGVPFEMHAHFMAGATLSLLAWWLEHDMPLSPRQMAQYLMSPHGALPSPS